MLAFRDKPVTALQVGQQLGAAYVLEGSIRRAGNRVRITAQLVEVSTRHSVWAERYDRLLEDVFGNTAPQSTEHIPREEQARKQARRRQELCERDLLFGSSTTRVPNLWCFRSMARRVDAPLFCK